MHNGLVVIGGGPAGHAAAAAYREADGAGRVRLITADLEPPYTRPPLSKAYLRGDSGPEELPLAEPGFYDERGIEVQTSIHAMTLDLAGQAVVTSDGTTHRYDACVLAPGSVPSPLPVPGGDHPDVLSLRSHADGDRLRSRAESAECVIVVGSGFIGCEAAVSLALSGRQVTLLSMEAAPQIDRLGAYAADRIRGWLTEQGVSQVFEASVERMDDGRTVVLDDGSTFSADLVLGAVGVTPQSRLARAAGLTIEDDRIRTDAALRTSDAHVWSAGDAALAHNTTAQRSLRVEHWGEALAMGEIAGHNAADGSELRTWSTVPGFWTEIGSRVLKYAAWGDGFDRADPVDHGGGAFSVWYSREGACVGVLTHDMDDDYERGREIVASGQAAPV